MEEIRTIDWFFGGGIAAWLFTNVIVPLFKKKIKTDEDRIDKIEGYVNTLWDSHNQKKDDSSKLNSLQENFTTHERKFEIFAATQTNFNTLISSRFEEIKQLIIHKENGQKNIIEGLFTALNRIEDKLDDK